MSWLLCPWYYISRVVINPDLAGIITLCRCHLLRHHALLLTLYGLALANWAHPIFRDGISLIWLFLWPLLFLTILSCSFNFRSNSLSYNRVVNTFLCEILELWLVTQDYVFEGTERVIGCRAGSKWSRFDKLSVLVAILLTHATNSGHPRKIVVTYVHAGELRP